VKKLYSEKVRIRGKIFFLFSFSLLLMSCLSWLMQAPSFTLRGVTLQPLSFNAVNLLFDLDAQNPNSFDLTLKSFEYTVYLKSEEIGNGRLEKELLIPSSSTSRIQVRVAAGFKNLSGSLKAILTEGDLPYKIEGKATIKTAFGSRQFPFSQERRINLKN
jgi:LEA14-like dessication related protein